MLATTSAAITSARNYFPPLHTTLMLRTADRDIGVARVTNPLSRSIVPTVVRDNGLPLPLLEGEHHRAAVLGDELALRLVVAVLNALREALPDATEHAGHLRINAGSFCRAAVDVELRPFGEWVQASAHVADVVLREPQRLRLNDYTTFFRTKQDADRLVVEGELPAAMADADGMRWLAAQIAVTAETVGKNLSLVTDVS